MKKTIKRITRKVYYLVGLLLYYSGILTLYIKKKFKNKLLIVFYHEINNIHDLLGEISTKPYYFEEQMKFLSENFIPISTSDIKRFYQNHESSFKKSVLITFDGGYKGNLINAYPILKKYSIPGLIYLITDCVENDEVPWTVKLAYIFRKTMSSSIDYSYNGRKIFRGIINDKNLVLKKVKFALYKHSPDERSQIINELSKNLKVNLEALKNLVLTWDDIIDLNKSELINIGSHTLTHPRLNEIPKNEAMREITSSKRLIESKIGERITSFCYPDGNIDKEICNMVEAADYENATTTINGTNDAKTNPYLLKRIGGGNMPIHVFALKISGLFIKFNV